MTSSAIEKLLSISSSPLGLGVGLRSPTQERSSLENELEQMLRLKDGFYAFESALHVFPCASSSIEIGLDTWNSPSGWRQEYAGLANDALFFAEDIFGEQFCIKENEIHTFDPETGKFERMCSNLEQWARNILEEFEFLTGHPIAHEWQAVHGRIPAGKRLVPRVPFVLGGEYKPSNLVLMDSERGMRIRGNLARQLIDLPDGTAVRFSIE